MATIIKVDGTRSEVTLPKGKKLYSAQDICSLLGLEYEEGGYLPIKRLDIPKTTKCAYFPKEAKEVNKVATKEAIEGCGMTKEALSAYIKGDAFVCYIDEVEMIIDFGVKPKK
jgi:hypothetical protein